MTAVLLFTAQIAWAASPEIDFTFNASTHTITGYNGLGGHVEIPSAIGGVSVISIGSNSFYNCIYITSITIPSTVTSIGSQAFRQCVSLTSMEIPESVTFISSYAFHDCVSLVSINIPSSVTSIESYAFYGCTKLVNASFSGDSPSVGTSVFGNCNSGFTVYYVNGAKGFTSSWNGYPAMPFSNSVAISTDVASLNIPEGGTALFKVKLRVQPMDSKTVRVGRFSGDADISVSSGSILTFTTANWDNYQNVTLAAAEDKDLTGGSAVIACSEGAACRIITATEIDNDYNLTVSNSGNGTTVPAGANVVQKNAPQNISATPDPGYHFLNWTIAGGKGTFANPNSESTTFTSSETATVKANFALNSVAILTDVTSLNVPEGGTAIFRVKLSSRPTESKTVTVVRSSGSANISISSGSSLSFSTANWDSYQDVIIAAAEDADAVTWNATINCAAAGVSGKLITVTEIDNDCSLTVLNNGNGTTVPSGATVVRKNSFQNISAIPNSDAGYHFSSWTVSSGTGTFDDANASSTVFTASGNAAIIANFAINTYAIIYTSGENGTLKGASPQTVTHGANGSEVTAVPDTGYHFVNWSDGSTANPRIELNVTAAKSTTANFSWSASPETDFDFDLDTHAITGYKGAGGAVVIPLTINNEGVTSIGRAAFEACTSLTSITFPSTVTSIGQEAFHNCSKLATAYFHGNAPDIFGSNVFSGAAAGFKIYYKSSCTGFTSIWNGCTATPYDYVLSYSGNGGTSGVLPKDAGFLANVAVTVSANTGSLAKTGCTFAGWNTKADGSGTDYATGAGMFSITADTALYAKWTVTVTFASGSNGTIIGNALQTWNYGGSCTAVTAAPNTGYHFDRWSGGNSGKVNPLTLTNVTSNMSVIANFAINTYTLSYSAAAHGSISGIVQQSVNHGAAGVQVTATPEYNYHFVNWSDASTSNPRTDVNVTEDISVTANFAINTFLIGSSAGTNGSITPSANIDYWEDMTFTITPDTGYHIVDVVVDNVSIGAPASQSHTFTHVTTTHTISASFAINQYSLKYNSSLHGNIIGANPQIVSHGSKGSTVTAAPNPGYYFTGWSDGVKTFSRQESNVSGDIALTANFCDNSLSGDTSIMGLSGDKNSMKIFTMEIPPDKTLLTIETSGGSVDCDVYVKFAADPSTADYYAKSTNHGTGESFRIVNPAEGIWHIMIYGYDDYSGVTLIIKSGMVNPASTLTASTNRTGRIMLNWTEVNGATGYEIFRSDVDNVEMASKIKDVAAPTLIYNDLLNPAGRYKYYYWIRAVDANGKGEFSHFACGMTPAAPSVTLKNGLPVKPPINGSADSLKTYQMKVLAEQTLLEVNTSGGTGDCDIEVVSPDGVVAGRSICGSSNAFIQIQDPAEGSWLINLHGVSDYSGLLLMAKYSKATAAPAAPVISATNSTYEDRVVITWAAVPTATSYEVYRNEKNVVPDSDAIPLGEVTDCIFEDNTAGNDKNYHYFTRAKNSYYDNVTKSFKAGIGRFSAGNSGCVATTPAIPGAVTASDGIYFDKIRVTWTKSVGATSYLVFRTDESKPAPDPSADAPLCETTALFYDNFGGDIVPQVGGVVQKYYYWIAAKNRNGTTVISKPNNGYLSNKGPAAVTASNTTYPDRIIVTWSPVTGATSYDVYRYTDSKFQQDEFKVGGDIEGLECEDNMPPDANKYYYRVKANYGDCYESDFSTTVATGRIGAGPLPSSDATFLFDGETSKEIGMMIRGSRLFFSADVPFGTARLSAVLSDTNAKDNDCDLFAKFANLPSTSSYNAKGLENKTNEALSITNPAPGTWYFLLYGATEYSGATLKVNCYSACDIRLTQVPFNDMAVPFKATFKGQVLDESGSISGIPNIVLQVRNPITNSTGFLTKTDANGFFSYSTVISTEGEHTFDFFFTSMPDAAKGTASHTVATRKGCLEAKLFDFSSYLPATPIPLRTTPQNDLLGMQTFLGICKGWDEGGINPDYEEMWINDTIVAAPKDPALLRKLDEGLYMFFYGVEGAGAGNDMTASSALSTVPFLVHVSPGTTTSTVLANLKDLGIIDDTQYDDIDAKGKIGVVAVVASSNPGEGVELDRNISLLAREQLEILEKLAAGGAAENPLEGKKYSDVITKKFSVDIDGGMKTINVTTSAFVK